MVKEMALDASSWKAQRYWTLNAEKVENLIISSKTQRTKIHSFQKRASMSLEANMNIYVC